MFGFLKDKLKKALGKFSKDVEKESVVEKKEILVEERPITQKENVKEHPKNEDIIEDKPEKRSFFQKIFGKKEKPLEDKELLKEEIKEHAEDKEIKDVDDAIEAEQETKIVEEIKKERHISQKDTPQTSKPEIHKKVAEKETIREIAKEPIIAHKEPVKHEEEKVSEHRPIKQIVEDTSPGHKPQKSLPDPKKSSADMEVPVVKEEKKSIFTRITETFTKFNLSEEKFEELFWDLEVVLLENNVAVEVIDKIKSDMKRELMSDRISRKGVEELIVSVLRKSIIELFDVEHIDIIHRIRSKRTREHKPYIITIIGVNGSGKTTSIAKLTNKFQKQGLKVVLSASDTFRAAAIQQLEEHANRLDAKIIKHDYNSDPAAVAFDAIKYAEAKDIDVVIIDTAGRLHSNTNLMEELKKVVRVCKPDMKIFVGESITGNDCVEQAKEFDKAVGIDAIILAKADVDEKGGAAISVSYVTKKPIIYIGTGQTYDDLKEFDSKLIIQSLEL
jgi:fused signal recognition particle receptor